MISALAWDADVDSTKIDVNVAVGMVTLKGTVNAYWKKYQAEDNAYSVDGALNVINELGVVPNEDLTDEAIATDIESALERNAYVNPNQVTVEVNNGTVTVTYSRQRPLRGTLLASPPLLGIRVFHSHCGS